MPRPINDTPFRRFMMQGIMWIILGGTVGLAALVNQHKQRLLHVELGPPTKLDGISIRLPQGWESFDAEGSSRAVVSLRDPEFDDELQVSLHQRTLFERFRSGGASAGRGASSEQIPVGSGSGQLVRRGLSVQGQYVASMLTVSSTLPDGRELSIELVCPTAGRTSRLAREIELIKQIAASVRIETPG